MAEEQYSTLVRLSISFEDRLVELVEQWAGWSRLMQVWIVRDWTRVDQVDRLQLPDTTNWWTSQCTNWWTQE